MRASAHRPPSCSATWTALAHGPATCWRCGRYRGRTGGITEFVPLPFVHMQAPLYLKGGLGQGVAEEGGCFKWRMNFRSRTAVS